MLFRSANSGSGETATDSVKGAAVTLEYNNVRYDGAPKTPKTTVVCGGKTLTENTDYTVIYSGNIEIGEATATIYGVGKYKDTETVHFSITKDGPIPPAPKPADSVGINFDMNGHGRQTAPMTVSKGSVIERPEDPEEEDWKFDGWYSDPELTAPYQQAY